MKKTIKETREMMNKINEFLSEDGIRSAKQQAAEEFLVKYETDLAEYLGPRWQTQGGEWSLDKNKEQYVHDLVWQFATDEYPQHMGDEEKSERFVQSVMEYI